MMRAPQQTRSRETLDRILAASLELLEAGGWDAVTVNEVGRRASVSRGAFYTRFPSREALVAEVRNRLFAAFERTQREAFARIDLTADFAGLVEQAVAALDTIVTTYGPTMAHLVDDPRTREESAEALELMIARYRDCLLTQRDAIAHPDAASAVAFTMRVVFESFAFSARAPRLVPAGVALAHDAHAERLAAMVLAYLTTPARRAGA